MINKLIAILLLILGVNGFSQSWPVNLYMGEPDGCIIFIAGVPTYDFLEVGGFYLDGDTVRYSGQPVRFPGKFRGEYLGKAIEHADIDNTFRGVVTTSLGDLKVVKVVSGPDLSEDEKEEFIRMYTTGYFTNRPIPKGEKLFLKL